jgi:hypothetical protein
VSDAASTVLSTFVGALIGGAVTLATARYYYLQATKDLREEAARFQQILDGLFSSLEESGWVRLSRGTDGRIVGILPTLRLGARPSNSDDGNS